MTIREAKKRLRRAAWKRALAFTGPLYDIWTEVLVGVADAFMEWDDAFSDVSAAMGYRHLCIRRRIAKRTHGA